MLVGYRTTNLFSIQSELSSRVLGQDLELLIEKLVDQPLRRGDLLVAGDVPLDAQVVDVAGFAPFLEEGSQQLVDNSTWLALHCEQCSML